MYQFSIDDFLDQQKFQTNQQVRFSNEISQSLNQNKHTNNPSDFQAGQKQSLKQTINEKLNEELKMMKRRCPSSEKLNYQGLTSIKGNVKNAYIKKINSLVNLQYKNEEKFFINSNISRDLEDSQSSSSFSQELQGLISGQLNHQVRKEKNRESAKNSRLRKKLYIKLLEKKVSELNNQIQNIQTQTQNHRKFITSVIEQNACVKGMIIEQSQLRKKIKADELEVEKGDDLRMLVDSYKLRFGETGTVRFKYMAQCMQNIVKTLLDGNYGILLFGDNKDSISNDDEFNTYVKGLKEVAELQDNGQFYKLLGVIKQILNHKANSKKQYLIKQLKKQFKELRKFSQFQEDVIDDITNQLSPQQFSQMINLIEQENNVKVKLENLPPEEESQQNNEDPTKKLCNPLYQQPQMLNQLALQLMLSNQALQQQKQLNLFSMANPFLLNQQNLLLPQQFPK